MFRQLRDRFGVEDSQYEVSGVLVMSLSVMSCFDFFYAHMHFFMLVSICESIAILTSGGKSI